MNWTWRRFADLGIDDLHDALQLRCRVFILEQGPYLDVDGLDRTAWHLLGRDEAGTLVAYLRVVDPGVKFAEPSIGRVVTAPEVRGTGLGRDEAGTLVAYLRVVDAGVKFAEPSIGRVVTAPEVRGTGLGRVLMREGLAGCALRWPGRALRISAQARLQRFYAALGFRAASDEYPEDGIAHLEMLWRPA